MIIEIPDDNSIVKWKKNDKENWKSAEISDLIKVYEGRPEGEWINHRNDYGHNIADCSLCGKTMQWHDEDEDGIPRYCWYCGAEMKGSAEWHTTKERQINIFCENADEKAIEDMKAELQNVIDNERPQGEWIPVLERLPEKAGEYLCSLHYAIPPYHMLHPEKDIYVDDVRVNSFDGTAFVPSVIAWQPLPEPYKKGGAEE